MLITAPRARSLLFALTIAVAGTALACAAPPRQLSSSAPGGPTVRAPDRDFTHPPEKAHDPAAFSFGLDQMEHRYRVPGEYTHRLIGDRYGFQSLSFIISETHPGGGPALHVHDVEEAHVLLEGSATYRIGDQTFTVQAPYIAKVPAGVPHTFANVGDKPFNLIAVFASKHPESRRVGPNPLIPTPTGGIGTPPGFIP